MHNLNVDDDKLHQQCLAIKMWIIKIHFLSYIWFFFTHIFDQKKWKKPFQRMLTVLFYVCTIIFILHSCYEFPHKYHSTYNYFFSVLIYKHPLSFWWIKELIGCEKCIFLLCDKKEHILLQDHNAVKTIVFFSAFPLLALQCCLLSLFDGFFWLFWLNWMRIPFFFPRKSQLKSKWMWVFLYCHWCVREWIASNQSYCLCI